MGRLFCFDKEEEIVIRHISYMTTSLITVFPMVTITVFAKPDWPIDTGTQLEAGTIMDMDSGVVLFTQSMHEQKILISITKLLTALVVIENTNDLDVPVIPPHDAIYNVEFEASNKFDLEEGDVLSIRQCLYAMLFQSFNQSANVLAEYVAGSRQAFMDMMNQQIAELGYDENHFANPSGLNDDTQRTTVYGIAIIARACLQNSTMLKITSARTSTIPATTNNPNGQAFSIERKMLLSSDSNYYPDAITDKTGRTSQTGQTLVTYIRREGRGQIAITLENTQKTRYSDTRIVLDFCFTKSKNASTADNEVEYVTGDTPITIAGETYDPLELLIESRVIIIIPNDAQFTDADKALETNLPGDHPQETVARLVYTYNERRVGGAWIYNSGVQAANATPSGLGEDMPQGSRPEKDGQDGKAGLKLPRAVLIGGGAVLVSTLIIGGEVFWFRRRQVAGRERQRILRGKRGQRLADIGYTEEDFERLLDERGKQHDMR